VLNCSTDTIQVTEGRKYFPCGPVGLILPALGHSSLFGRGSDKQFSPQQVILSVVDVFWLFCRYVEGGISVLIRWLCNLARES